MSACGLARLWRLIKYPGPILSDRTLLRPLRPKHWDLLRGPHALALEQATCGARMSPRRAAPTRGAILLPWGQISKWPVAHGLVLACEAEKGGTTEKKERTPSENGKETYFFVWNMYLFFR